MKGVVKVINGERGFGFLTGEDKRDYFVHRSDAENFHGLREGDAVEFVSVEPVPERGLRASAVKAIEATAPAA